MRALARVACLLASALPVLAANVERLAQQILESGLDPDRCYHVREVTLVKEDLRIYFTEGYLILGKPVAGAPVTALFSAEMDGGDGELLTFPPERGERLSLSRTVGAPNFSEHFTHALLVFGDDTGDMLLREIEGQAAVRPKPDMGLALAHRWESVVRNISESFQMRLIQDLLSEDRNEGGFFYAAVTGRRLGNFDVLYDPQAEEQIRLGRLTTKGDRRLFEVWAHFAARSFRNGSRPPYRDPVTLEAFRIEATLHPDLALEAVTRVRLTVSGRPHAAVAFEMSPRMAVTGAAVDGKPAEVFRRESLRADVIRGDGNDVFLVEPSEPLLPGRTYEVEVRHHGSVIGETDQGIYFVRARGNWYPNRNLEFAAYDLTFRYPKQFDLVASGTVAEDRTEDEWRTTRHTFSSPARIVGFNLGRYDRVQLERAGYRIEVCGNQRLESGLTPRPQVVLVPAPPPPWNRPPRGIEPRMVQVTPAPPPRPVQALDKLAARVADAFGFMAERYGPPPTSSLTVSPVPGAFGQGFPGLVYLSTLSYLEPGSGPLANRSEYEKLFFSELLHAHETAHQWWGNVVRGASYRDDWLMEAAADYSALLYAEKRHGEGKLRSVLDRYRANLLERGPSGERMDDAGPIYWGPRLEAAPSPGAYRIVTYQKGAWIFHMLRRAMGDTPFFAMMRGLLEKYAFRALSLEGFKEHARGFLPAGYPDPELEGLFGQYVYDTGIPVLSMKHRAVASAGQWTVEGQVVQRGVSGEFSIHVPVDIQFGGKSQRHWVRTDSGEAVAFRFRVPAKPSAVVLNPGDALLAVIE